MKIKQILEKIEIQTLNSSSLEDRENGLFVFRGLPNELALTVGNHLRRILLSYIDGIAITAVKISNKKETLKSEFVPLSGVLETPPYIILNLKNLILKTKEGKFLENTDECILSVDIENEKNSEYVVSGNDVKDPDDKLEILNKDSYIATVSPNSNLHLKIWCKKFWGFSRENEKKFSSEEGLITIDSNYNPVKNVSFKVDMVVVGLNDQEEQLTVNIRTNGSITPHEALSNALSVSNSVSQILLDKLNKLQLSK